MLVPKTIFSSEMSPVNDHSLSGTGVPEVELEGLRITADHPQPGTRARGSRRSAPALRGLAERKPPPCVLCGLWRAAPTTDFVMAGGQEMLFTRNVD